MGPTNIQSEVVQFCDEDTKAETAATLIINITLLLKGL